MQGLLLAVFVTFGMVGVESGKGGGEGEALVLGRGRKEGRGKVVVELGATVRSLSKFREA